MSTGCDLLLAETVIVVFKHEFLPYPLLSDDMDFWCLSDFAQLSSLGDLDSCEALQARRKKGERSLS